MEEFWRFLARGLAGLKVEVPEEVVPEPLTWNQYLARGVPGVPDRVPSSSSSSVSPVAEVTAEEELPEPPKPEVTISAEPSQQRSGSGIFATTGHPKPSAPPPTRSTAVVPPAPPSSSSSSRPLGGNARVVLLWSSISTDSTTARMEDMFAAKKLVTDKYDGSWPDHIELRNKLFSISGQRGKYPQCFISRMNSSSNEAEYEFIGLWEAIENLADMDSIPADFLATHPEIKTFTKVFADVKRI